MQLSLLKKTEFLFLKKSIVKMASPCQYKHHILIIVFRGQQFTQNIHFITQRWKLVFHQKWKNCFFHSPKTKKSQQKLSIRVCRSPLSSK
nr:MAG TPA: hypothetical protein [Caudoviricetes sp.]